LRPEALWSQAIVSAVLKPADGIGRTRPFGEIVSLFATYEIETEISSKVLAKLQTARILARVRNCADRASCGKFTEGGRLFQECRGNSRESGAALLVLD
jgi:hypothetical protein